MVERKKSLEDQAQPGELLFFFLMFIYLFCERERVHVHEPGRGRERERERERIPGRIHSVRAKPNVGLHSVTVAP